VAHEGTPGTGERLDREGIEFEVWDAEVMSLWLKERPSLVYDFFGRLG
jgi:hypothetical protein